MKRSVRAAREIAFWQPWFRNLDGWTIGFDTEDDFKDQSHHNVKDKKGIIFDWSGGIMPRDYIYRCRSRRVAAIIARIRARGSKTILV